MDTRVTPRMQWRNSFAGLGDAFFTRLQPTALPEPYWVGINRSLAAELGLEELMLQSQDALEAFTGNVVMPGSEPLASVYSGHQFGQWAGQLGDGRAILLGEVETHAAQAFELQLKGAGLTPYSRMGDGRAVLRSSIREFLCSEAMHGLGIPTTRALCVTGSDARVRREEIETAAVVTRVAPSFVRFGHFEHFSYNNQHEQLKVLADYIIDRFYPACLTTDRFAGNPYAAFLEAVSERTAAMVAQWQAVGFCHGVMNTDNMSILGLTIDYGPFQFLDAYNPGHICNHSDTQGRYAYNKQPNVAYWNVFCLGQALLPLIGEQEQALTALESYKTVFPAELERRLGAKLGLSEAHPEGKALIEGILKLLAQDKVDFTIFWRTLSRWVASNAPVDDAVALAPVRDLFIDRPAFDTWLLSYSELLTHSGRGLMANFMLKTNPKYVLRNHLGEEAIQKAKLKDFSGVNTLLGLLEAPFNEQPGLEAYAGFPPDWASSIEISCSS
jgi:serine/tyrosine/threonine adenylyltransferase